jgi:hypothetical protein
MTKAAARGTKRWCQDEACGLPFYDLNKVDIACPNCGAVYTVIASPPALETADRYPRRMGRTPFRTPVVAEAEVETAAEVADVEDEVEAEAEADDAVMTEALLEPDDDEGADVAVPVRPEDGGRD